MKRCFDMGGRRSRGLGGGGGPRPVGGDTVPDRRSPAAGGARGAVAGSARVPGRRRRPDLAAVGRSRVAHAGRRPRRREPFRLVHPVLGGIGRAREPARPRHHRDEPAARHQPDVEHVPAAPGRPDDPGNVAGGPADQPDRAAHPGLRGIRGLDVLGAAALGSADWPGRARRGGLRVLAGHAGLRGWPLPPRVRGAAAADDRRRAADHHWPRSRRQDRDLAGAAGGRAVLHRGRTAGGHGAGGRRPGHRGSRDEPARGGRTGCAAV